MKYVFSGGGNERLRTTQQQQYLSDEHMLQYAIQQSILSGDHVNEEEDDEVCQTQGFILLLMKRKMMKFVKHKDIFDMRYTNAPYCLLLCALVQKSVFWETTR